MFAFSLNAFALIEPSFLVPVNVVGMGVTENKAVLMCGPFLTLITSKPVATRIVTPSTRATSFGTLQPCG